MERLHSIRRSTELARRRRLHSHLISPRRLNAQVRLHRRALWDSKENGELEASEKTPTLVIPVIQQQTNSEE